MGRKNIENKKSSDHARLTLISNARKVWKVTSFYPITIPFSAKFAIVVEIKYNKQQRQKRKKN